LLLFDRGNMTQLGSGPFTNRHKFYSKEEYIELLQLPTKRMSKSFQSSTCQHMLEQQ
jgi:hypothetical protein